MIALIALCMILYVGYCIWIIDIMIARLALDSKSFVASLFLTIMPAAIIAQILFSYGIIK